MKQFFTVLFFICPALLLGQEKPSSYPQHYFRNPLDIPIFLAGNFGECRPGHFHSGIDIKTLGKEGQPVHSAADGYISRIKMDKSGFGHGIYITHPNGYTTLYGHLANFAPAIQKYVRTQQYAQQHWDVDLQLSPTQFPVKKGELIAWSGNTGGSTAPHLHFEIRDTKTEHPLNPERFGLPIVDKKTPLPLKIVAYDLTNGFYNNQHTTMSLKAKGKMYAPENEGDITLHTNTDNALVGIGIEVNDYMEGSDNTLAHYTLELYDGDAQVYTITLDNIGYDETRYVNAYADYATKKKSGYWVNCLFQLPGNRLNTIYSAPLKNRGYMNMAAGQQKKMTLKITDDMGNAATVKFNVALEKTTKPAANKNATKTLFANQANSFEGNNLKFEMNDRVLYDSVAYTYDEQQNDEKLSAIYKICTPDIPMHTAMQLSIKPDKPIPFDQRDKVVIIYTDGTDKSGDAATGDMGWYKAAERNFGTYWLDVDTTAPVIKPMLKDGADLAKAKLVSFTIKDNMTSVKKFKGMLDGKWVCIEQHSDLFFYTFDEHCPKGKHKLILSAADENNNTATTTYNFTR